MKDIIKPYSHIPSLSAVSIGVVFGASRIIAAEGILKAFPSLSKTAPLSPPIEGSLMTALVAIQCIVVPFFEERLFRRNLKNPTFANIMKNSFYFGLMHGFLPGSVEYRVARIFMSTIGGVFYCYAKNLGKDTYSSAIAHSMYN